MTRRKTDKKVAKRMVRQVGVVRVPITVWVMVPIFNGMPRLSHLAAWAREQGFVVDLSPIKDTDELAHQRVADSPQP